MKSPFCSTITFSAVTILFGRDTNAETVAYRLGLKSDALSYKQDFGGMVNMGE